MSDNPNYYSQEGQTFQHPVRKKRKYGFIKFLAFLLIITVLSMSVANYFLEPVLISRFTKGLLFGFHTKQVTKDELENTQYLTKPTEKEIRDFSKFAKQLSNRVYISMTGEQKEDFIEIKNGAKQITAFFRKTKSSQNPPENTVITASNPEQAKPTSDKSPASFLYFGLTSVALGGSQSPPINTETIGEEGEENIYDPEVLNDISAALYANGYPELATAVSSMAAAEHSEDPISALNLATLLREANANEDAFNVLQYALRLNPDSEPILYSLGMCALELENTAYAETCFSRLLSLNASSGPGHQGMMLCYMDTGNYSSAFLHMLEGAREGYTTMVTETYKALRQKNEEYFDIAKPIFEQYSFQQLMDFSKSRTPFDDTLDTPAGQLEISREIHLGRDSVSVYSSSQVLNEGLQYAMSAYEHGKATFDDAFGMIQALGGLTGEDGEADASGLTREVSKLILEKIFGAAADGTTVSNDGWLGISYEAEVFWLNILEDYVKIKVDDNLEEYFTKTYDEAFKNPDSVSPSLMQFNETLQKLCEGNPIQAGSMVLNNLINNNSVYDTGVQKANKADMDKFLENVSPRLEEGYKKTADLMEEYWTYYGGILGHIGNDETYNRYQQSRKTTVACALTPYVVAGTMNCFLVTMNFIAVDSDNMSGGGEIKLPDFPDFPESQMGERYEPPAPQQTGTGAEHPEDDSQEEGTPEQEQESPGSGEISSETGETEPGSEKTGEGEITTEDSITISIGPFSASFNSKTGYEIDLTAIGSTNLRYNPKTRDLSLFGGVGGSVGVATSNASARTGVYTTVNLKTWDITSGTRSTLEGQLAGNGIGVERQTSFATGADATTVSAILLHKKSSQTIDNN